MSGKAPISAKLKDIKVASLIVSESLSINLYYVTLNVDVPVAQLDRAAAF